MASGHEAENRRTLVVWETLIESQKSILRTMETSVRKSADVETAVTLMGRRVSRIEDKLDALSTKMDSLSERLQSVSRRFDDVETQIDQIFRALIAGQTESIALDNKILSAVQNSLNAETRVDDLQEKLDEVRHRIGM